MNSTFIPALSLHAKLCKVFGALLLGAASCVSAQDFPAKPITMVMPYAAGGPGDTITRLFAGSMQNYWVNKYWLTTRLVLLAALEQRRLPDPNQMATPCS